MSHERGRGWAYQEERPQDNEREYQFHHHHPGHQYLSISIAVNHPYTPLSKQGMTLLHIRIVYVMDETEALEVQVHQANFPYSVQPDNAQRVQLDQSQHLISFLACIDWCSS